MGGVHSGHRRRLLSKALKLGIDGLEEHEVLEIMLFNTIPRGNTNEMAHDLLNRFGSLYNVCMAEYSELMEINGIGTKSADFLKMLPLFAKAYDLSCIDKKTSLDNPEITGRYCHKLLYDAKVEELYIIYLSINKRILKRIKLGEGSTTTVSIRYKEILKHAINTEANYVVICHNHPNGMLIPSQNDITFTTKIASMLDDIGVEVLDHVVVTADSYFSFAKENISVFKNF